MKILMVCLAIFQKPIWRDFTAVSKKQVDWRWRAANGYQAATAQASKVALLHGIDISNQRARNFSPTDFQKFDKIYVMADDVIEEIKHIAKDKFDSSKVDLIMNELYPGEGLDVFDPWYGGSEDGIPWSIWWW